jgi:cytidylate kinase
MFGAFTDFNEMSSYDSASGTVSWNFYVEKAEFDRKLQDFYDVTNTYLSNIKVTDSEAMRAMLLYYAVIDNLNYDYDLIGENYEKLSKEEANLKSSPYYVLAEKSGICEEVMEAHDEKGALRSLLGAGAIGSAMSGIGYNMQIPMNQRIFQAQFDAITQLAQEGPCVFVGRCADYVLRGLPNVTHVFIYASPEHKTERIMRVEGVSEDKAREMIRKTDKQRKSYYNFYADGNWGMRSNYDLMLRTDGHSLEELVELIAAYAHMKVGGQG